MSFTAHTKHYRKEFPHNEQYTSFKLELTEYSIFHQFYEQLRSKFTITNTDHECHLQWTKRLVYGPWAGICYKEAVILVEFPKDCKLDGMKIIVSVIDNNGTKVISESIMKENEFLFTILMTDLRSEDLDSEIENYLHNGTLTIFCELVQIQQTCVESILIDNTQIHAEHFYNNVPKKLREFFENEDLWDVNIVVEHAEFHAHKIVLAANSPVFDAMFASGMKEQIENTVTITDIDASTFEEFLRYMYTGTVARKAEQVHDLLMIADKYEVVSLINLCKAYMANKLNIRTEHCQRQCPNKIELTSFIWDLTRFVALKEIHSTSSPQFVITNTEYECQLKLEHYDSGTTFVHLHFPKDCKLTLKVIVSFVDGSGIKLETKSSMKQEQTNYLRFSMDSYHQAIHSDSGDLTILCEIIYVDLTPIKSSVVEGKLENQNLNNSMQKKIEMFFNDKCFCDVTVVVKDAEIYAHKAVLAANSAIFKAMFSENVLEPMGNTITIDDSDANTFKAFVTFMYTGSIGKTEQLVRDLLFLAEKYQVLDLVTLCKNYTQRKFNIGNVNALIASELSD